MVSWFPIKVPELKVEWRQEDARGSRDEGTGERIGVPKPGRTGRIRRRE